MPNHARAGCGVLMCALIFPQLTGGESNRKGSATLGLLVPSNAFFQRSYKSALLRSIANNIRNFKSLSAKYEMSGKMNVIRDSHIPEGLCSLLQKHRLSTVIILRPKYATSTKMEDALKKAAQQQLPVIIWDSSGTTSRLWKGSPKLVLYLSPTVEQNGKATGSLTDLAARKGWQNIAIISDGTPGATEFVTQMKIKKRQERRLLHYTYETNNKANLTRVLLRVKVAKRKVLVLFTTARAAITVLKEAAKMRMTGKSYLWILSNTAMPALHKFIPVEFPVGLMGFRVPDSKSDAMNAIQTAVTVWARGLDSYVRANPLSPKDVFVSKGTCKAPVTFKTGPALYSKMLDSGSGDSSDSIIFSEWGTSSQAKLLVYNINKKRQWKQVGNWTEPPDLNVAGITWPDGQQSS